MSLRSRSSNNTQLPQLMLDADSSAGGSYAGGFRYSASGASQMPESPTPLSRPYGFQDEENLLLDVGLFIDENGNIIEEEPRTEPQLPAFPSKSTKTSGGDVVPMIVDDDDDIFNPNPALQSKTSDGIKPSLLTQMPSSPSKLSWSPSTMVSRAALQKASRIKLSFVDGVTQIPLSDYFHYVINYTQNMEQVAEKKDHARALRRAHDTGLHRKIAHDFIFGRGVFGVADAVKAQYLEHPLAQMFSGDALEETLFGEGLARAKRRRLDTVEPSTPVARGVHGVNLDGFDDEQDIELGRQPASALSDNPSLALNRHSSALPGSSAHGSVQRSASGIRHLPDGRLSSAGFPDSPSFFERYSDEGIDFAQHPPGNGANPFIPSISSVGPAGAGAGIGASAATDKAKNSQANNDDKVGEEVRNASVFFELVREMATNQGLTWSDSSSKHRWVEFGDVVAPFKTNRAAVVGAFMSLLTLTTARKLRIKQDDVEGDVIDRGIFIGVKPKKRNSHKGKGKAEAKGKDKKKRSIHEISEDNNSDDVDELMSDHVFPGSVVVNESFFLGSELSNIELVGAA